MMSTNKNISPVVAAPVTTPATEAPAVTPLTDLPPAGSAASPVALIYQWLFDPDFKGGYQRQIDSTVALLIVLSVFAVVLETIPEIHVPNAGWFHAFDLITVGLFTLEYVLRVVTAPMLPEFANSRYPRLRYVFSLYALIDLIAIAPFYLVLFTPVDLEALRVLRLMRLARIFKLSRVLIPAWEEFQQLNAGRIFRTKFYA